MVYLLWLNGVEEVKYVKCVIDCEFMMKYYLVMNLRYTDGFLFGGRVTFGKNKWVVGMMGSGVEGVIIFSVYKVMIFMLEVFK